MRILKKVGALALRYLVLGLLSAVVKGLQAAEKWVTEKIAALEAAPPAA